MIWLLRLLYILRWPIVLAMAFSGFLLAIAITCATMEGDVFASLWEDFVEPGLFTWPMPAAYTKTWWRIK